MRASTAPAQSVLVLHEVCLGLESLMVPRALPGINVS